jgi:PhnB protein
MAKLNSYLNFDGNAEEAFNFYKSIFGGEFMGGGVMKMGGMPNSENVPESEKNRVMHVALPITGGDLLMASDILPSAGHKLIIGNNNYICISPESKEEADRLFAGLSEGGEVEMPMEDQFWGDYFGSFKDKYGVCWMISYNPKKDQNK